MIVVETSVQVGFRSGHVSIIMVQGGALRREKTDLIRRVNDDSPVAEIRAADADDDWTRVTRDGAEAEIK